MFDGLRRVASILPELKPDWKRAANHAHLWDDPDMSLREKFRAMAHAELEDRLNDPNLQEKVARWEQDGN